MEFSGKEGKFRKEVSRIVKHDDKIEGDINRVILIYRKNKVTEVVRKVSWVDRKLVEPIKLDISYKTVGIPLPPSIKSVSQKP